MLTTFRFPGILMLSAILFALGVAGFLSGATSSPCSCPSS